MNKATQTLLNFFHHPDMQLEAWREHTPITGNPEVDIPKLRKAIYGFAALDAVKPPIWPSEKKEDKGLLKTMACDFIDAALDTVDWAEVLKLWS
jgi:hypothetical protein